MGMSASQARFLCLTARKNNVEFEGQQINQQRTTLSNESASYYSELCNMAVPVPPSIDDYTKVSYTFNDGAMSNTVTSLLYSNSDKKYHLNYIQQWQDDYSIVPASSSLIQVNRNATGGNGSGNISIGNANIVAGAENNNFSAGNANYDTATSSVTYSIGGVSLRILGVGPDGSTINSTTGTNGSGNTTTPAEPTTETPVNPPTETPTDPPVTTYRHWIDVNENGTTQRYEVFYDEPGYENGGQAYYNKSASGLTSYEKSMIKVYNIQSNGKLSLNSFVGNDGKLHSASDITQQYNINNGKTNEEVIKGLMTSNDIVVATENENSEITIITVDDNGKFAKMDDNGNIIASVRVDITNPNSIIHETINSSSNIIAGNPAENIVGTTNTEAEENIIQFSPASGKYSTSTTSTGDEYWDSLNSEGRRKLLETENYYIELLRESCGDKNAEFYVRYQKNTTTGVYEPYFYRKSEIETAAATDRGLISVSAYTIGSETKSKEILNQKCVVEQDTSGRYVALTIELDNGEQKKYTLNTTTTTDEDAYNDAMNDYNYKQHAYDHKIQEINSKLEIIQQQDKQLELKLKQLDTEENAISTEMDAVKKVISKNVDNSFKTFSA